MVQRMFYVHIIAAAPVVVKLILPFILLLLLYVFCVLYRYLKSLTKYLKSLTVSVSLTTVTRVRFRPRAVI